MYGDTAAARKRVAQLREQSGDVRALADRLVAQAEAVPWHGRAAEAMRARIKDRAAHLRAAAAHHETAADSLARHLAEVDRLQAARFDELLARIEELLARPEGSPPDPVSARPVE